MNYNETHKKLCDELNDTYTRKNKDYGNSFHTTFTEEGMAAARIRLGDKFNRFRELTKQNASAPQAKDESIRDTLMDLANYALMTVMELDSKSKESTVADRGHRLSKGLPDGTEVVCICIDCAGIDGSANPKHVARGRWNRLSNDTFNCCKCGQTFMVMQGSAHMNFCPNCGIGMAGTKKEPSKHDSKKA